MSDPADVIALGGLTATLAGALIWVIKFVLATLIPQMQASQTAQIQTLCESFREDCDTNRGVALRYHEQMSERLQELTGAIGENQRSLVAILERLPIAGQVNIYHPPPADLGVTDDDPDGAA